MEAVAFGNFEAGLLQHEWRGVLIFLAGATCNVFTAVFGAAEVHDGKNQKNVSRTNKIDIEASLPARRADSGSGEDAIPVAAFLVECPPTTGRCSLLLVHVEGKVVVPKEAAF